MINFIWHLSGMEGLIMYITNRSIDLNKHEPVSWVARWIQNPVFYALPYRHLISHDRNNENNQDNIQNIHTLFRKTFKLKCVKIKTAKVFITGDDYYKLYINGVFIGSGPAQSYLFDYKYNGWDITDLLVPGENNCIAVHVYYQGLLNYAYMSADNMQGLITQLEVEYIDGSTDIISSDKTWKYYQSDAWTGNRVYGYYTQFAEDIDLRKWQPDWNKACFDDTLWEKVKVPANPWPFVYNISAQHTPTLEYKIVHPQKIIKKGKGNYFIDFGFELVGTTVFLLKGEEGHTVEIRHAEELSGPHEARYEMRAGCKYQEFCTLSGRDNEKIEFFEYKGFRYVEVLNWPCELKYENIWVISTHYPFPEDKCEFNSSDNLLNDIWNLCKNGVKYGTQDTYLDCPTREKGGFLGDGFVTAPSHLILTGDSRIFKKFLNDFSNSTRLHAGMLGIAPSYIVCELADYSMLWPMLLEQYYLWTNDLLFVKSMLHVIAGLLEYYSQFENEHGLLFKTVNTVFPEITSLLVDWPVNLRDSYDFDLASKGVCTSLNLMYYGFLETCARIYLITGDISKANNINNIASQLHDSCIKHLYNMETGLFVDALGSTHSSLHANVLALTFNFQVPKGFEPIINLIKSKKLSCGVYFANYILKGLCNVGEYELAYKLIVSKHKNSWYSMLKAGATTCMEVWDPDIKWNTSWCHPWSSSPITIISHEIMGLKPCSPGWKKIKFEPHIPDDLKTASISITTPVGNVKLSFKRNDNFVIYNIHIPEGSEALCTFTNISEHITINSIPHLCIKEKDDNGDYRISLQKTILGGIYEIVTSYVC